MVKKLPGAERSLPYYPVCMADVRIGAKRVRGQKLCNRSLNGTLENSNRLQNTDHPVNIIKNGGQKKGFKNALHSTFMHLLSCQVE